MAQIVLEPAASFLTNLIVHLEQVFSVATIDVVLGPNEAISTCQAIGDHETSVSSKLKITVVQNDGRYRSTMENLRFAALDIAILESH